MQILSSEEKTDQLSYACPSSPFPSITIVTVALQVCVCVSNTATNTIHNLYLKDLYQQKWLKTIFTGRGAQGNHIGHKRIFLKALIHEKIPANTLQIPYWLQRWCQDQIQLLRLKQNN
jgi:hypothetical protein